MNWLFLFSRLSGDKFRVIPYLLIALDVGISSFRKKDDFVKRKVQDVRMWSE
jgi:hypothetical protein